MAFGIQETGFVRKTYQDILSDLQARARTNFGTTVNLDQDKPLGKFLDIIAWFGSEIWEKSEDVYNAIAIDTAEGIQLDRLVKYKGLRRLKVQTASGTIRVFGTPGLSVPSNFIVGKDGGVQYFTSIANIITVDGYVDVEVTCSVQGTRGNADIGLINLIITPITGITSVINLRAFVNGQDNETDEQLRDRFLTTVGGLSTVESIRVAISNVVGVLSQVVIENVTMFPVDGIPAKSFESYVYGGIDEEIALAILNSKPAGIQAFGTTVITTEDINGFTHEIGFTRAEVVSIDVEVTISVNQFFPFNGEQQIKTQIINYIGGTDFDGSQFNGLKIGDSVNRSYIISRVWNIVGLKDVQVKIKKSTDPVFDPDLNIIELTKIQIARCDYSNIEVIQI